MLSNAVLMLSICYHWPLSTTDIATNTATNIATDHWDCHFYCPTLWSYRRIFACSYSRRWSHQSSFYVCQKSLRRLHLPPCQAFWKVLYGDDWYQMFVRFQAGISSTSWCHWVSVSGPFPLIHWFFPETYELIKGICWSDEAMKSWSESDGRWMRNGMWKSSFLERSTKARKAILW